LETVFARANDGTGYFDADNQVYVLSEKAVNDSAAILNPNQLGALERFRAGQVAEQQLKELNRIAAGKGLLKLKSSVAARYRVPAAKNEKKTEGTGP
jgi:hypothetical protein